MQFKSALELQCEKRKLIQSGTFIYPTFAGFITLIYGVLLCTRLRTCGILLKLVCVCVCKLEFMKFYRTFTYVCI